MNLARVVPTGLLGGLGLSVGLLSGCEPALQPLQVDTKPALVAADVLSTTPIDAVLPTDVLPLPSGEMLVLDGYAGRILLHNADGSFNRVYLEGRGLGRPVRMAPSGDGALWLVDPGKGGDTPTLVHITAAGAVDRALPVVFPDESAAPVSVVELGASLVVSDRAGHLHWMDALTGEPGRKVEAGAHEERLQMVVDLGRTDRGFYAVDAFGPRVQTFTTDGTPLDSFGRFGVWAGRMYQPKSAASIGADWIVADSALSALQVFDAKGGSMGLLAVEETPIAVSHAIAIHGTKDPDTFVVLDANPARLLVIKVHAPLPTVTTNPRLRYALLDPRKDPAGTNGQGCVGCHDGLVRDDREAWDPDLGHHPVDIVPERTLPSFFPLDPEGKIVCTTCHSPHGVVSGEDAGAADGEDLRPTLVRHKNNEDPFTRLGVSNDSLCIACHEGVGHVGAAGSLKGTGKGHPTGAALVAALDKREARGKSTEGVASAGSCLGCHAPHGASGPGITRAPTDGRLCVACHEEKGVAATNHPIGRSPGSDVPRARLGAHLVLARDGGPACLSCHDLIDGRPPLLLRTPADGGLVCLACHSDRAEVARGPHAKANGRGPACLGCHDPHGGPSDQHLLVTVSAARPGDPVGCRSCHDGRKGSRPGAVGHPVDGKVLPDKSTLTCLSCHDPHEANKPDAASCETCHTDQATARKNGGHGSATCLDCHETHAPTVYAKVDANPASQRCLACHATGSPGEGGKVTAWEHPAPVFKPDGSRWQPLRGLPLYDAKGGVLPEGKNGALTCQSCHVIHGPEGDADHLRRAEGWQDACASCHGKDALVLYRYFHRPDRREEGR